MAQTHRIGVAVSLFSTIQFIAEPAHADNHFGPGDRFTLAIVKGIAEAFVALLTPIAFSQTTRTFQLILYERR
jgi:hypothetical protein